MKRIGIIVVLLSILFSCKQEKTGNMIVKGTIKGLQKGTLFLQKMDGKKMSTVDSVIIFGTSDFQLATAIESSEIFYLTLNKNNKKRIPFFGEKGTITITSKLDKFNFSANIEGSKNHLLLEEYSTVKQRFNDKKLEAIKARFEAEKANDKVLLDKLALDDKKQLKRRYLYTINYAINHADSEIAPYLAVTELYNAQVKWLDSINNTLTQKVKASKYGKDLAKFIKDIKAQKTN